MREPEGRHSTESARPSLCGISFPGPREREAGRGYHAWPSAVEVATWCGGGLLQGRASCAVRLRTSHRFQLNSAGSSRQSRTGVWYGACSSFQQMAWEKEAVRVRARPLWLLLSTWILSYLSNIFILHVPAAGGLCLYFRTGKARERRILSDTTYTKSLPPLASPLLLASSLAVLHLSRMRRNRSTRITSDAFAATKVTLNTNQVSTDAFPPLRSVVSTVVVPVVLELSEKAKANKKGSEATWGPFPGIP
ncbi:hypothetical protein B0H14DRAFT_2610097 [Mycena olivaceomarginata]|nr:hypothetical protein B0H14DRAFT_2610097 [Mycena olivaceomarginata]